MRSSTTWKKTPEANSAVSGHSATAAGITVRDRSDDWLTVWEHDRDREDLVHVRYLGADPCA